jgi:4-amino-4-deoxy-L-arabinose transferase-like glycosyltransferase
LVLRKAALRGGLFHGRGAIVAVVAVALVVRIAVIVADDGYVPQQDAWDYDRHALSIAGGDGFPESYYVADEGPSALRAPGYPFFLGAVYVLSGDSVTSGRLANAALGALAVLFVYLIAKRIWGRRVGLFAAAGAAVFPPLVLLSKELLSEPLFIALALGMVLAVLEFRGSRETRWAILAGALAGLAALTRNPGPALAIPLLVGLWVGRPRWSWTVARVPVAALLCAILVVFPWTVRNAVEFGRFIPVTSGVGFATAGTYNQLSYEDDEHPASWRTPLIAPEYTPLFAGHGIDEGALDASLREEATSFAREHPLYVLEVSGWNLLRMFEIAGGSVIGFHGEEVTTRGIGSETPLGERIGLGIAVALATLGAYAIWRSRRPGTSERPLPWGPLFLWLVPILLLLVSVPINGLPRQRTPIDPFLLILTGVGAAWMIDRLRLDRVRTG